MRCGLGCSEAKIETLRQHCAGSAVLGPKAEPGRLPVRQAGMWAAAERPCGAQLRLLCLRGLPARPGRLLPQLRRHLCHLSLCVLQGALLALQVCVMLAKIQHHIQLDGVTLSCSSSCVCADACTSMIGGSSKPHRHIYCTGCSVLDNAFP